MRRLAAIFIGLGLLVVFVAPVRAQTAVSLADVGVTYTFGDEITFSARIQSGAPVQQAFLFFQAEQDPNTRTVQLYVGSDGAADYMYSLQNGIIRPFAKIYFWYHIILTDSTTYDSPRYFFQYDDNRFPWQTIDRNGIRMHWYAGDTAFGQSAFNAALRGYQAFSATFPVTLDTPLSIYVYASATDVQNTLSLGGYTWVGGHASPDLGVVLVSIAPGDTQDVEMNRQIPHELAHVLLYHYAGQGYANLPTWLQEGIASQMELAPNPDYTQLLTTAVNTKSLFAISSLCGPFPVDASGAILAYAESDSFTRYLQTAYGAAGLQALIQAYSDGLSCDQGSVRAVGASLAQLDNEWQQSVLGVRTSGSTFQNFLPYLVLFAILLVVPAWKVGANLIHKKKSHEPTASEG